MIGTSHLDHKHGNGQVEEAELNNLGLWIDDGDAVLEDGEMVSALEYGVSSVSTNMEIVMDDDGKELMQSSAAMEDGSTILSEDVWFAGTVDAAMTAEMVECECEEEVLEDLM